MSFRLSDVLRQSASGRYMFYCPGCGYTHMVWTEEFYRTPITGGDMPPPGPAWTFDGNVTAPTFAPSVRHFHGPYTDPDTNVTEPEETTCHYFIRGGKIEFCGDSKHDFAGMTIDMCKFPEGYGYDDH